VPTLISYTRLDTPTSTFDLFLLVVGLSVLRVRTPSLGQIVLYIVVSHVINYLFGRVSLISVLSRSPARPNSLIFGQIIVAPMIERNI
jgi:hypothetical protein